MLILNRMIHPYEIRRCSVTDEPIFYGDFFYEDDTDGTIVKASVYKKMQEDKRKEEFDYTLLNRAQSQKEYNNMLEQAQREYLKATILDRPIFDQGHCKKNGME